MNILSPEAEAREVLTAAPGEDEGRPVRVRWTDSGIAAHGWQTRETAMENDVPDIETVGLWVGETERCVVVAGSRDAANCNWGECQIVWKSAIISKEWLA